jgi:Uma2 family endonuclease
VTPVSAQPIQTPQRGAWQPDPARQRLADYTIEDVLNLPEDAPRVELIDGVVLVVPSPAINHQSIASLTWAWLRRHAPEYLHAVQAVGVAVDATTSFEPDIVLRRAGGDTTRHFVMPDEVVLAVEVVSPGTRTRDRITKPATYAAARIPYYWRIEQDPVHVYAYKLVGDAYKAVGDSADRLVLDEPFAAVLDIAEITPERGFAPARPAVS